MSLDGPPPVVRERLLARMAVAVRRRLTLVHAGGGFGKTTLLTQWAQQASSPVVRLHLEDRDNEPVCLLSALSAALGAEPQAGALRSGEALLAGLMQALARVGDLIVVLDGYDAIEEDAIHRVVAALLSGAPPCVRFVISSRVEPPLPLGRLRTRREVTVIKERELCFTADEAEAFFEGAGFRALSSAGIKALTTVTNGWIAGLQLAAFGLRACDDARAFVDALASRSVLLVAEALAHQSPALRDFLLVTSILQRKSGAACDALTGGTDGEARLREMCAAGVVCGRLPGDRAFYRTHPVLDEHLRAVLERDSPERLAGLHAQASAYFADVARWDDALFHAARGGDFERAADLIEAFGPSVLARGEAVSLRRSLDALPGFVLVWRPRLASLRAEVASLSAAAAARGAAGDLASGPITGRQRDVLELMRAGYSCREIALRLHLSQETVRVHYRRMSERLAVTGRA
jgi:LuxR family transcriptional regulator, maltose regulon positive regulatory protein